MPAFPGNRSIVLLLIVLTGIRYCANAAQSESDFAPASMGWRATEIRALTNYSQEKFVAEAKKYREEAAKSDATALLNLAVYHEKGLGVPTNFVEAASLVRRAAQLGFAPAQNQLALYLSEGIGLAKDTGEAFQWWQKAAAQGFGPAEYLLGYCYLN